MSNTYCQYQNEKKGDFYICNLGLYGGRATERTCATCIRKKQNNQEFATSLLERFAKSHPANRKRISGCCDRADQA